MKWSVVSSAPSSSEISTLLSLLQMRILTVELRKLPGHVRRTVRTPRSGYVLHTFRLRVPDGFDVSFDSAIMEELPWLTIADILIKLERPSDVRGSDPSPYEKHGTESGLL